MINKQISDFEESIFEKIRILNETLWEYKIDRLKINTWLENFQEGKERIHALYLLSQFMYFGSLQIKELLKSLYRDLYKYRIIENIRKSNSDTTDITYINNEFNVRQNLTRFIPVGNSSESGSHLLYYFRQENKLQKDLFISDLEIFNPTQTSLADPTIIEYIFFDDFCGSGNQAVSYLKPIVENIKKLNNNVIISYYVLFSTKEGKQYVDQHLKINCIDSVFELDESFKCFSNESRYFHKHAPPFIDKTFANSFLSKYGLSMMEQFMLSNGFPPLLARMKAKKAKFGFGDCQLLIGFEHNTPDNTLPVFWWNEDKPAWVPIFKRYNKIY